DAGYLACVLGNILDIVHKSEQLPVDSQKRLLFGVGRKLENAVESQTEMGI
ncbi:uncharacterized, partial [Tachysurus ichikawai]